jgi:hypothetical protein
MAKLHVLGSVISAICWIAKQIGHGNISAYHALNGQSI